MKRAALYSSAVQRRATPVETGVEEVAEAPRLSRRERLRGAVRRYRIALLGIAALAFASIPVAVFWAMQPAPQELSQEDIDSAVLHTLENQTLPSRSAKAAELVRQSVVRVRGYLAEADVKEKMGKRAKGEKGGAKAQPGKDGAKPDPDKSARAGPDKSGKADPDKSAKAAPDLKKGNPPPGSAKDADKREAERRRAEEGADPDDVAVSTGSGVVILDKGVILTNLHVVQGAHRLTVTFYDGMESEAEVVGVFPENDLAVLQAKKIPDDLPAATLGSSARLKPGDEVVAVGFPFGIGPSVSSGVVSGLNREFRSPKGQRDLKNLIQFDAAANSGNSGGPLVTMDGEVVGIVTAILNPHGAGTFIGIGFAVTIEGAGAAVGIAPF